MLRTLVITTTATMAFGLSSVAAFAADKVSVRLNWYLVGLHAPLVLGVKRGYFAKEGIDLTINEGRGSVVAAQTVAAGGDTFGFSDGGTVVTSASRGLPIKAVMVPMNVSPFGIIARTEAGIRTAKDLEGKTVAVTAGDSLTQLFPAVIAANKLGKSSIRQLFIDAPGKVVAVIEGRADALLGAAGAQDAQLSERGIDNKFLAFWDLGVQTIGMSIHAHRDTVKNNPDMVRRFVRAAVRSYEEGFGDPEAAVDAAVRAFPDQNRNVLLTQLRGDVTRARTPELEGKPAGYADPKGWAMTLQLMKQYAEVQTNEPAEYFYTNEFVKAAVNN